MGVEIKPTGMPELGLLEECRKEISGKTDLAQLKMSPVHKAA
jgi:hypothetical protein